MRSKRILWLALLLFAMTFTILPVSAAETSISVGIPVQVESGDTPAVKGDVLFTLTPVEGAPAPAQSGLRLAAGNGSILPAVTLPKPDTYVYRLQAAPADPSSDYIEARLQSASPLQTPTEPSPQSSVRWVLTTKLQLTAKIIHLRKFPQWCSQS